MTDATPIPAPGGIGLRASRSFTLAAALLAYRGVIRLAVPYDCAAGRPKAPPGSPTVWFGDDPGTPVRSAQPALAAYVLDTLAAAIPDRGAGTINWTIAIPPGATGVRPEDSIRIEHRYRWGAGASAGERRGGGASAT